MTATVPKLRRAIKKKAPGLHIERELWESGHEIVVGVDEVGRGAWAGPITVGAAVVPKNRRVYKVRDSKMLTEDEREAMFDRVSGWVEAWAVGHATYVECDELGMSEAQILATRRALDGLGASPSFALVDGKWDFVKVMPTKRIVKGDAKSLSIAAASILAKVSRDRLMRLEAMDHPGYNFENNKGYPCPLQKQALAELGPSAIHRRSWAFMDTLVDDRFDRYVRPDPQMTLFDAS
jgi:ribonuclease HII